MKKFHLIGAAGISAAVIMSSAPAMATEGYFSHGYGAVNKSMAGAGVATGFDAMSQATNPAALSGMKANFTADLSAFSPHRSYEYVGSSGADSDRELFFIPSLAANYPIDGMSSFGWAFYANGGMNTTYPASGGPFGSHKTGVDLGQGFMQFTYARELTPGFSIGVSPVIAVQRFKAFGLFAFGGGGFDMSADDTKLTNNGYDWSYGYGGKLGVQSELGAGISLGVAYQTRMYMSEFDEYAGLFAEQGDFDIPPTFQAGLAWDSGSGLTVALDYKRIWYGDIASIANPMASPGALGDDDGRGFGWETIDSFKLGLQYEASPTLAVRAGVARNDNPIPSSEVAFNILAPGVQEWHYTAGLSWQVNPNNAITFGAMYSPSNSVTGANPFAAGDIEIEMWQWEATVGWTWTF